jgi:hypothetical protein
MFRKMVMPRHSSSRAKERGTDMGVAMEAEEWGRGLV